MSGVIGQRSTIVFCRKEYVKIKRSKKVSKGGRKTKSRKNKRRSKSRKNKRSKKN